MYTLYNFPANNPQKCFWAQNNSLILQYHALLLQDTLNGHCMANFALW